VSSHRKGEKRIFEKYLHQGKRKTIKYLHQGKRKTIKNNIALRNKRTLQTNILQTNDGRNTKGGLYHYKRGKKEEGESRWECSLGFFTCFE
jgi:hypothetical protein